MKSVLFDGCSVLLSRVGREAKENKIFIFFVPRSSTLLSSWVAEGPAGAFGASRRR